MPLRPLWLVRHAQPLVEAGVCYGATDLQADAADTRRVAVALAEVVPAGMALWCSPLRRCVQLAEALQALRPELSAHTLDPRLAEMDFGHWEGWRWSDIPQEAMEAWTSDFADHVFGGRESVQGLMARVQQAWLHGASATGPRLWITHAGVMRAASLLARGHCRVGDASLWPREPIAFGELLRLDAGAGGDGADTRWEGAPIP